MLICWNKKGDQIYSDSLGLPLIDPERLKLPTLHSMTYLQYWNHEKLRITGQYKLGTATAEVTTQRSRSEQKLEMRFTDLKDGLKLYTLIREGIIFPITTYCNDQATSRTKQFWYRVYKFIRNHFQSVDVRQ